MSWWFWPLSQRLCYGARGQLWRYCCPGPKAGPGVSERLVSGGREVSRLLGAGVSWKESGYFGCCPRTSVECLSGLRHITQDKVYLHPARAVGRGGSH